MSKNSGPLSLGYLTSVLLLASSQTAVGQSIVRDRAFWAKNKEHYELALRIRRGIKSSNKLTSQNKTQLITFLDKEEINVAGISALALSDAMDRKLITPSELNRAMNNAMVSNSAGLGAIFFRVMAKGRGVLFGPEDKPIAEQLRIVERTDQNLHTLSKRDKDFVAKCLATKTGHTRYFGLEYLIFKDKLDETSYNWIKHLIQSTLKGGDAQFTSIAKDTLMIIRNRSVKK